MNTPDQQDDDGPSYWLCCGSMVYPHGEKRCYEAAMGYPEHVRWGTKKQHSEWARTRKQR